MKKQMQSFTDRQAAFIESEAVRLEVSQAEVVRRALDWYIDTYPGVMQIEPAATNSTAIACSDSDDGSGCNSGKHIQDTK